jgi:dihydrolipoamide dehydrogenase
MSQVSEVTVPDIGDFSDVPVIEILVAVGDTVAAEDPLVTLESDKATMDVPAPYAGTVKEIKIGVGDTVSEGSPLLTLERDAAPAAAPAKQEKSGTPAPAGGGARPAAASAPAPEQGAGDITCDLVVLGAGPGGYTAAFRAADLGLKVVLVERHPTLGGVCLNVGCIPSKALLHAAKVIGEAREMAAFGIDFGQPKIDLDRLRGWKEKVVGQLTGGLAGLAKQRKVEVINGWGSFASPNQLRVETADGVKTVGFRHAIVAAGSQPVKIPGFPHDDPRVVSSTGALELKSIPQRMLVVGGGIIGLEMATVYHELGSKVTVVELMDGIIPGADRDIVKPLHKRIEKQYEKIYLETRVTAMAAKKQGIEVSFDGPDAPAKETFDLVLVAVGRTPNGKLIGAEHAGIEVDERGFIQVDKQQRTNVAHIFAIGDVVGQPMLAHKATHEGKVAAEVAAGQKSYFDARVIPSVAYTDPEVAWVGMTENEAKAAGRKVGKGSFPWAASGRSLSIGRNEGLTKLIVDQETHRVIGGAIVGTNAGELIAEVALAIEMGATPEDIGLTVHPHPTLSETVCFAAEMYEGTITDLVPPKHKK